MTDTRDPMAPDGAVNPIDTDYKVGQDKIIVNIGPFGLGVRNRVFAISGLLVVAFVVLLAQPAHPFTKETPLRELCYEPAPHTVKEGSVAGVIGVLSCDKDANRMNAVQELAT